MNLYKADVIVLCVWGVCALVAFLLWLNEQRKKEVNRHAEALMDIESSRDIGQTAWANTSVHKDQLIRKQAAEIAELRAWKKRTETRLAKLHLSEVFDK